MGTDYAYKDIEKHLWDLIYKHQNETDYILPSEMQLVRIFKVSRNTARKAYANLEKRNIVKRGKGRGTFINAAALENVSLPINIGFVMVNTRTGFSNSLLDGARAYCKKNKLNILTDVSENDLRAEARIIKNFVGVGCRGLIVMPADFETYNEELMRLALKGFPVALVDRTLPNLNLSSVSTDHYGVTYELMRTLRADGCERVVYFTVPNSHATSVNERNRAFERGLLDFFGAIKKDNFHFIADFSAGALETEMAGYFRRETPPDAILMNSGQAAAILLKTLTAAGLLNRIRLVFFDDEMPDIIDLLKISPYVVVQDAFNIGYTAAELVNKRILGETGVQKIKLQAKVT
ncbi:MAG: substrate-binding domain-containing protein [Clostridiales bacterium]|jgi:DNA-binding LacI/PurR family transcriptional regulator|nr:substrate-binding domain-containing protein [Clostridiales bacterium]